jgi:hypothetical protein
MVIPDNTEIKRSILQHAHDCKGNWTPTKSDKQGDGSPLKVLRGILSICRVLNKYNICSGNP